VTSGASIDQPFLMHKHQSQKTFWFLTKKLHPHLPRKVAGNSGRKCRRAKDATDQV